MVCSVTALYLENKIARQHIGGRKIPSKSFEALLFIYAEVFVYCSGIKITLTLILSPFILPGRCKVASGLDEKAGDKYRILDKPFYLACGTSKGLFSSERCDGVGRNSWKHRNLEQKEARIPGKL